MEKTAILKLAKSILDDLRVTFSLEAGTLLLAYRDGKFDETDVDLSVYEGGFKVIMANLTRFTEAGFVIYAIHEHPSGKATQLVLTKDGQKIDIWQKIFREGQVWWVAYSNNYIPQHVDEKHFKTLDKFTIWGEEWNIPHDVEGYLEANYGDWKTPNPDWVWHRDPKSIDYSWEIK